MKISVGFPAPQTEKARQLVRAYSGEPLPPDPGPGARLKSYRLPAELVRQRAALAGESRPAVFLRRLLFAHWQGNQASRPAQMLSTPGPALAARIERKPEPEPVARPKAGARQHLGWEQVKREFLRLGVFIAPQPDSVYFLDSGGKVIEEDRAGRVVKVWP